jgi:hypothetical protein
LKPTSTTVDSIVEVEVVPTPEQVKKIATGVSFILKHFDGNQQLFPRYLLLGPKCHRLIVYNAREIIDTCLEVDLIDCRIMAYPIYPDSLKEIAPCVEFDTVQPHQIVRTWK